MSDINSTRTSTYLKIGAVSAAITFLYAQVLAKLGYDWWTDENYSHGLLVPFVIGMIVWKEWDAIKRNVREPAAFAGTTLVVGAIVLQIAGTLGAELFTRRISLMMMLAGVIVYFFGLRILNILAVPFVLLLLAIPIPQIVFNRIAFPLQVWASQMAVWGIRLFEVPTVRKGNVFDILPRGATQTISLEVVEACSGIRSLMTLVTLALILGYFTRRDDGRFANFSALDLVRTLILMAAAIPIAVVTNAGRVTGTGVLTYYYGKQATDGAWHDVSGWLVYLVALALLIGLNFILGKFIRGRETISDSAFQTVTHLGRPISVLPVTAMILLGGLAVNWFVLRGEAQIARRSLGELPIALGEWKLKGSEIKFDASIESVLKTTDYTMREYTSSDGRIANLYVGYYASQRSGATYHSPQNCLPGAGWVMKDPQYIDIPRADGTSFRANRYVIQNGIYNEVMIYWYQGRGRFEASEYADKLNTVVDSVTRSRSDGSIVRVMTSVGHDETAAVAAAVDLSARLADSLLPFVPE